MTLVKISQLKLQLLLANFTAITANGNSMLSVAVSRAVFLLFARISELCDQMAVMMYDTAIPLEKFYVDLMTYWTKDLAGSLQRESGKLILGVPAYDDHGVGYHYPHVENLSAALRGISAADRNNNIDGIAIYCNWEMDESEWQTWRKFIR